MLAKLLIIVGLVSAGLLLIIFTATTPSSSGAFGILAVFLLGYIVSLVILTFMLWSTARIINRLNKHTRNGKSYILTLKKAYYYSSVVALGPVIMISLQSVGGIGLYEVGLMILFIFLGCIYVSRRSS
jgi:hypothetical protein